ncbi:hypothetical protein NDK47_02715 [Brevibacillus ruminantium]|uniref:Uncharacterized protein n=1 Tax=Brevibacillus ruminantium TaxID=2950604 RepID=A0ABY4WNP6_9BACL|nr:hypothetical protein [Brevibacillus ruminantium]USG66266.1 hypothetical protein NDK47_02715 [Brevibacillus ruminantium]
MEEFLLLLSLDDFFALLSLFAGFYTSVVFMQRYYRPQSLPLRWRNIDTYEPSINRCLIETYPRAARQPYRKHILRCLLYVDSDCEGSPLLFSGMMIR